MTEVTENIYNSGSYLSYNPDWHAESSPWKAARIINILEKNRVAFSSLAEVGCGAGAILQELESHFQGKQLVGYDISKHAKKFWGNYNGTKVEYYCKDFLDERSTFDVLMLVDVFEHLKDYLGFLEFISNRARYFVFHIPLDMHIQGLIRDKQMHLRETVGHLHYFSKATALATLEDTGYRVIDWSYTAASQSVGLEKGARTRLLNLFRKTGYTIHPDLTVKLLGGYSMMVLAEPRWLEALRSR